jgi:hypothetical protein
MIFISYRRDDSGGHVGRLYDALSARFGPKRLFFDIGSIGAGQDFVQVLQDAVARCAVLLVVIGKRWAGPIDGGGRRIDDPNDFVRLEVKSALEREGVRVIPVLVHGGALPSADQLPDDLKPLTRRNAIELSDNRWKEDVARLIAELDRAMAAPIRVPPAVSALPPWAKWAAGAAVVLLLGVLGKIVLGHPNSVPRLPSDAVHSSSIPLGDPAPTPTKLVDAARGALPQARLWRSDAVLTQIVAQQPPGSPVSTPYLVSFTFRSPADGAGLKIVTSPSAPPTVDTLAGHMSAHALPDPFIDLPDALNAAWPGGMSGQRLQTATLSTIAVGSHPSQPLWKLSPTQSENYRVYYVNAVTGQLIHDTQARHCGGGLLDKVKCVLPR